MRLGRLALGAAFVAATCASPPPSAPSSAVVAGAWVANSTLSSVASGGDCVGADLRTGIGRRDTFLTAIAGTASLQATITSQGNGTVCAFTGSNSGGSIALTMGVCQSSRVLSLSCSAGGRRDVQLVGAALQAQADSRLLNGSGTETTMWNVYDSLSQQQVGTLSLIETFTWVYLGLPSSDYHVFTGTVFPGYADGTITIPADPNPWCLPCGWFR